MRSKFDARIERRTKRKKPAPLPGGKALQRLFAYLGERDPRLNDEFLAAIPVPKSARPKFGLTKRALRAQPMTTRVQRGRRVPSAAKSFAAEMANTARALTARGRKSRASRRKARAAAAAPPTPAPTWQFIGPSLIPDGQTYGTNRIDVIGRVSSIAVDPSNPKHLLLGAAGGGIWESHDTGRNWTPCTDQMPSLAIGAIAFDPTDPKKVYAGSGEGNSEYATLGAGVYKSTDGGTTWAIAASAPLVGVGFYNLVVDPKRPNVLYGATTHGFFKSTNGGGSWSPQRRVRCWDLSVHPGGGSVELLAAFADGLFVSTSARSSFTAIALPSTPAGPWVRLAVDRVAASPDVTYVFGAVGTTPYLWRRAAGAWAKITPLPPVAKNEPWTNQAQYDWYVAATPDNDKQVYLGAIPTFRGHLAGTKWKWINVTEQGNNSIHPDQHCLTFSPDNSKIIYAGNDGGIFRSTNSGATWKALNEGLGITEIEYLATDPNTWKWLLAGTQDNGTIRFTGSTVWKQIADGDGGDCGVNHLNPNEVYHSYYYDERDGLNFERSKNKGDTWTSIAPPNVPSLFYPPVEVFGSTVGIGASSLMVTRTGDLPWTTVPLGLSVGEFSSAMRDIDANTILIGTTKGRMLKLSWTGATWNQVQLTSPASRYISCIAVDPTNPQRFWVTFLQLGGGMVYRSDNAGAAWVNCRAGLPKIPMNSVVVDPANFKRVWVAADMGVYQTLDLGSTWTPFSNGLPNSMAADLHFHKQDRMLICGTRSRGAWVVPVS